MHKNDYFVTWKLIDCPNKSSLHLSESENRMKKFSLYYATHKQLSTRSAT